LDAALAAAAAALAAFAAPLAAAFFIEWALPAAADLPLVRLAARECLLERFAIIYNRNKKI
jgi:hypothetical protein